MVNRILLPLLLCVATTAAHADSACSSGHEFEPPLCPTDLPAIRKITITKNAAKSPADSDPSTRCTSFRLRETQIRRYFEHARSTNANDAHHTLDWSPCYAAGEILFRDGRTGRWSIDQFRSGTLTIGNGEPLVLYCPDCKFKPFIW